MACQQGAKNQKVGIILDALAKIRKWPFSVIPAMAGIHFFQGVTNPLDSGFHPSDDFLRSRQSWPKAVPPMTIPLRKFTVCCYGTSTLKIAKDKSKDKTQLLLFVDFVKSRHCFK
jgi:hypothetical protein